MNEHNPEHEPTIQHPVLVELNTKVENLQSQNQALTDTITRLRDKYRQAESNVQTLLKDLLDDERIEFEVASLIAEIFDNVNLTKQVTIRYSITADVLVEMPYNTDADEIADDLYLDRIEFATYHGDAEVLETDYNVDDWNVC